MYFERVLKNFYNSNKVGSVCNNAQIKDDILFGQPTEGALLAVAMKHGMYNVSDRYIRVQEYPFSSEQKVMAVKCIPKYESASSQQPQQQQPEEIFFVKGAIEVVLTKCAKYQSFNGVRLLNSDKQQEFLIAAHEIARSGLRIIAMAKGITTLQDLVFLGFVGICDPPRPFVRESIGFLIQSGVMVKMITGDAEHTSCAIGMLFGYPKKK